MTIKAFSLLPLAVLCSLSAQANTQTEEDRITELEKQVAVLSDMQTSSSEDRFHFNGFASMNMQAANNSAGYAGATNKANVDEGSLIGLQTVFDVNDDTKATVQLVSRGTELENWQPQIEWAFISHQFTSNVTGRVGKLRLPLFMLSDYLEVGYAQLGARVPQEVYSTVVATSFTGGDVLYDIELDDSTILLQGFAGSHNLSSNKTKFRAETEFDNIVGAAANWSDDFVTLRASYAQAKVSSSQNWASGNALMPQITNTTFANDDAKFYGLGARYDGEQLFVMSELTRTETSGFYPDVDAGYVTVGYRIEKLTPYATVSYMKTKDDDVRKAALQKAVVASGGNPMAPDVISAGMTQALLDMERTSYSLGLRWDVATNLALKTDVTYVTDFEETNGGLTGAVTRPSLDDATVYTVKLDVVF